MKIVRYQKNDKVFYGVLEGDKIHVLEGDIFGEFWVGTIVAKREEIKLLLKLIL